MRTPRALLRTRCHIYAATITQDEAAGADRSFTLATANVACAVQPATSDVIELYQRDEERVSVSIFCIDQAAFDAATRSGRITHEGTDYEIVGKQDLSGLQRVFRIDCQEEAR